MYDVDVCVLYRPRIGKTYVQPYLVSRLKYLARQSFMYRKVQNTRIRNAFVFETKHLDAMRDVTKEVIACQLVRLKLRPLGQLGGIIEGSSHSISVTRGNEQGLPWTSLLSGFAFVPLAIGALSPRRLATLCVLACLSLASLTILIVAHLTLRRRLTVLVACGIRLIRMRRCHLTQQNVLAIRGDWERIACTIPTKDRLRKLAAFPPPALHALHVFALATRYPNLRVPRMLDLGVNGKNAHDAQVVDRLVIRCVLVDAHNL